MWKLDSDRTLLPSDGNPTTQIRRSATVERQVDLRAVGQSSDEWSDRAESVSERTQAGE